MTPREQAVLIFMIWLCVYPGVLIFSYGFIWLGIDVPLWLEILISTAVTVPLISLVAAPRVEKMLAAARHETLAEFKMDQAREAEGPDPEQQIGRRA